MAEQKIFAGPRIRRIRSMLGLTQTAMAESLGISPSYLNLIERNQRPLTVQLILKLAAVHQIDVKDLQGEAGGSMAALKEVFSDPLLAGELPGDQELIEVAEAAPNAAAGVIKLYRAYRESQERLSDLAALLAQEGRTTALSGARLPADAVRHVFEQQPNHFAAIEAEAEAFHAALEPGDDLAGALKAWLRSEHHIAVRTLPVHAMPNWRRRFDRHSMRLFLSERLSPFDQLRELAIEAALLRMRAAIDVELEGLDLAGDEQQRLARFELARYAGHALMMPYGAFHQAAQRSRYDIDVLRARFGVSFEHAANRLTTLQRSGAAGIPFFMLEIDNAGNRVRRAGAEGFPQQGFGGGCPKLPIHAAFAQPGQILVEAAQMPGGETFMVLARTLEGPQGGFNERVRRTAILIGCDIAHAGDTVYGQAIGFGAGMATGSTDIGELRAVTRIGPVCRLCERQGCLARAEPPVTRPLGLDEMVTGLSAFDFQ